MLLIEGNKMSKQIIGFFSPSYSISLFFPPYFVQVLGSMNYCECSQLEGQQQSCFVWIVGLQWKVVGRGSQELVCFSINIKIYFLKLRWIIKKDIKEGCTKQN